MIKEIFTEKELLDSLADYLPDHLWMIEVSIPELFPANYRKLGEMLLDAQIRLEHYPSYEELWLLARFPGLYLINNNPTPGAASFSKMASKMESHTPLYFTS